ncbi:hypothetical protein ACH4CE_15005 [Streptomyces gelaticus]|uniref:hypothetical protein n=1 Tax=Streptomyces gelaticus TaxID=285446 RepID=UPI0037976C94
MTARKPFCDGMASGPKRVVIWARTTPATALAAEMPMARARVLNLLAAAVSEAGTAAVISTGMAPWARPIPAPITAETSTSRRTADIRTMLSRYPAATTAAPAIGVASAPGPRNAGRQRSNCHHDRPGR